MEVENMKKIVIYIFCVMLLGSTLLVSGCSRSFLGGAAVGAAGAGAAYEYNKKKQMDQLEEDFEKDKIDKEEYQKRKKEIEEGSIIY